MCILSYFSLSAEIIDFDLGSTICGKYDTDRRCTLVISFDLTREDVLVNHIRYSFFRSNTKTASPYIFYFSGMARGHLCAGENKGKPSYDMFNIVAQDPILNKGLVKKLEIFERKLALEKGKIKIRIECIFLKEKPERWIKGSVQIPDAFYRVIYDENDKVLYAWYMENNPISKANPDDYKINPEEQK